MFKTAGKVLWRSFFPLCEGLPEFFLAIDDASCLAVSVTIPAACRK